MTVEFITTQVATGIKPRCDVFVHRDTGAHLISLNIRQAHIWGIVIVPGSSGHPVLSQREFRLSDCYVYKGDIVMRCT